MWRLTYQEMIDYLNDIKLHHIANRMKTQLVIVKQLRSEIMELRQRSNK